MIGPGVSSYRFLTYNNTLVDYVKMDDNTKNNNFFASNTISINRLYNSNGLTMNA